ncbi:glycoside hydrolase family 47 protein [Rhodotorula graminis WP1]|uniref:alpha-1,2-Mannosidase n=1 Tax=Rhodotorula graminis (strain WP1) TaxID=578459 RepID=A0A194S7N3_RHOGW|nr:glycoside hydrolase family 47 protein [Rhodotorula graminis WP1]KPV76564.1 glycoside hydrolase family 47 protein [Rhodotorula graminis WP1]
MARRKDAQKPPAKAPVAAPAQPARPAASKPAKAPPPRRPSPLRIVFLCFRISLCAFALYILYNRLHAKPANKVKLDTDADVAPPPQPAAPTVDDEQQPAAFEPIVRDQERRDAILQAFKHSYSAYERDAFGFDDYHPISHHGTNMSPAGPVGYFLIDSLDSLLLVGLDDEYKRARDWVANVNFDLDDKFHTFEITIRVLGGLLSAYHFSGETDQVLLDKAVDLADRLLPAFDTPSGLPTSFVNLAQRKGVPDVDNNGLTSVAEAGTLQLEFKYLSHLTGNDVYWQKVEKVMDVIRNQPSKDGLVPIFMRPDTGSFVFSDVRLGSRGDSYYEYLSKQYLQTNRTEDTYRDMHDLAMGGIKKHLLKKSAAKNFVYTSELLPSRNPMTGALCQDHLACFLGATLLLGATDGNRLAVPPDETQFSEAQRDDWYAGKALIRTCVDTYASSKTGLAPEIVNFHLSPLKALQTNRDWFINSRKPGQAGIAQPPIDARNILRPETVESLFVAYRVTGDPVYRDWGWRIFLAFTAHCKLPSGGYAGIRDVDRVPVVHEDRMETFWLSETLKYLYLLFSEDSVVPLDRYVFNTEAHPFPVFEPSRGAAGARA